MTAQGSQQSVRGSPNGLALRPASERPMSENARSVLSSAFWQHLLRLYIVDHRSVQALLPAASYFLAEARGICM